MNGQKPGLIRRFFGGIGRLLSWIRAGLANLFLIVFLLIVIAALIPRDIATMPESTALRVAPSGFLVDQYSYQDPITQIIEQTQREEMETRVRDVVVAVERAAADSRVTALLLDLNNLLGGSISKLEEVGAALQTFRDSGKPIYAVSDNYTHAQYYLASYADEIVMHPMGAVLLTGYSSYRNYFKSALDKLSMNMHVFRVGEYKDAVEPFLLNEMSEPSREHNRIWLNELWSVYTQGVEQQRQLKAGSIDDYVNNMDQHIQAHQGDHAQAAIALKLVDTLYHPHEQKQFLIGKLGRDNAMNGNGTSNYKALDYYEYLKLSRYTAKPNVGKVGLVIAKGMILDGEQPAGNIGSESLSHLIRQARDNDDIKALVVRVDSGGGSAFASEVIRQELNLTRQRGIPVLVSMGSIAASGGYWIAMGADEVWATPSTLTGSIGVFSAFPTVEKSLQKLGVTTDGVATTDLAGSMRVDLPLGDKAKNILQQSVESIYRQFLNIVAHARQSSREKIHAIAQGRVWTGKAALDLGLVDQLGTLQDTLRAAAERANLSEYEVIEIERPLSPAEQFAQQLAGELTSLGVKFPLTETPAWLMMKQINQTAKPLLPLLNARDPRRVFAQCVECIAP